jgi:chemotaxis protein CheX
MLFKTELKTGSITLFCPAELGAEAAAELRSAGKNWMMNPVDTFIFDCHQTLRISRDFYQAVIQFKAAVKKDDKKVCTLNLRDELQQQLRADGVEPVFNPVKPKTEDKQTPKAKPALDVALVNPFLLATLKTLEVQCSTIAKVGKPYFGDPPEGMAIASVLSLSSNNFNGSLVLCFPEAVFLKIYENMFGEVQTSINAETQDAASELLNIIYGLAKVELNKNGHTFLKALPTVLVGENLRVHHGAHHASVQVPFEIETGTFFVSIEFNAP